MAYWLCDISRQQNSTPVMRFDPRFWTMNFPRPMMASVVTTGPESLRAEAVFHRSNDLAGLIWDSVDAWDHPLPMKPTAIIGGWVDGVDQVQIEEQESYRVVLYVTSIVMSE